MMCRCRSVAHLAEVAAILARRISGDDLALCAGERVRPAKQKFGKHSHGLGGFRPERQESDNSRQSVGERNVGHEGFSSIPKGCESYSGVSAAGASTKASRGTDLRKL